MNYQQMQQDKMLAEILKQQNAPFEAFFSFLGYCFWGAVILLVIYVLLKIFDIL